MAGDIVNGQIHERVFEFSNFDDDEWNSRMPVTGNSGYQEMIKREKHFVRNVIVATALVIIFLFADRVYRTGYYSLKECARLAQECREQLE